MRRATADFGVSTRVHCAAALRSPRAEGDLLRHYEHDDGTRGSGCYTLTNLRGRPRGKHAFGEFWVRNAFDTIIPVAFPYPGLAPSGSSAERSAAHVRDRAGR
jgi:hypothetical protein